MVDCYTHFQTSQDRMVITKPFATNGQCARKQTLVYFQNRFQNPALCQINYCFRERFNRTPDRTVNQN